MFSIEHEFDSTVITLVDEGEAPLGEDVVIRVYEDEVLLEQYDPDEEILVQLALSLSQVRDLAAALDLPEGVYQLVQRPEAEGADKG